jgi:phosphoglycolate phosphatase
MPLRAILFDLDGTLVQTRDASWKLFCETNRAFNLGIEAQKDYFALFEDNFFASLRRLCKDDARADQATRHFLNLLQTAYFPDVVPGMCDVVRALAGTYSLAVLSSNAVSAIRRILTEANIAHCFSHVFAGDVEADKRVSVRRFLNDQSYAVSRACSPAYQENERPTVPSRDEIVLVTDTVGDVKHANECGIRAIGVAWGMHTEAQLLAAGAEMVAVWPQEIVAYLLPGGFSAAVRACDSGKDQIGMYEEAGLTTACSCSYDPLQDAAKIRRMRGIEAANRFAGRLVQPHDERPSFADVALLGALRRISRGDADRTGSSAVAVAREAAPLSGTAALNDAVLLGALHRLRPHAG